jgi:putative FmdB family regulatory protein
MPLREYQCDACGHRFEVIQKMSDPSLEVCPKCGGGVHKLQAAPAFHLKGTGWYVTDYAKKDQSSADKKDSDSGDKKDSDSKDSATGSTDKGETKADTAKSTTPSDSASSGTSTSTSNSSSTKNS